MKNIATILCLVVLFAMGQTWAQEKSNGTDSKGALATFLELIRLADVDSSIPNNSDITIIAPTEEAFQNFGAEKIEKLKQPENRDKLKKMMLYLFAEGNITTDDMTNDMKIKTYEGQDLTISIDDGDVMINDAAIVLPDVAFTIFQSNKGTLHVIDKFITPPDEN